MKKWNCFLLAAIVLLGGCQKQQACNVNEGMICFDEETERFIIEEEAHIRVTVDSEAYGEALKKLWIERFPDHPDALEMVIVSEFDGKAWLNQQADVGLIYGSEAARLNDWLLPIEDEVKEEIMPTILSQYGESVNHDCFYYVPMIGYGWVFSTNKTMLQSLGVDISDADKDGLVDALDSFEKITAWADLLKEPLVYRDEFVQQIFQFDWDEASEWMTWLSLAGFKPFETFKAEEPGWESESFLNALQDLSELGQHTWSLDVPSIEESEEEIDAEEADPRRAQSSAWGAEFYLSDYTSVFSMVGTWMYYDEFEALTDQDFLFSAMPSYKGETAHPYTLSAGYVINKNTDYPNACLELLRLIRSEEGLQAYADNAVSPLLYADFEVIEDNGEEEAESRPAQITFKNENLGQISRAMRQGAEESMVAYALDPTVRGWDMLEGIEINAVLKDVFEQRLSSEEAQSLIMEKAAAWMLPYLPPEEEQE